MIEQRIRTAFTDLTGVAHPIVQTGMGWVAGPRLVSATAEAGAMGILASATMTRQELEAAIIEVTSRTERPFGVNLRADAQDASDRVKLMIDHGVALASFALQPDPKLIERLKEAGIVVMPSVGAPKHAVRVAEWGADAVLVQGGEGGGHTGAIPTTLLLPQILDAVDLPVIAAGGFFDGRGLAAAIGYGAAGIGMGTRFLLTADSAVPLAVKQRYLASGLDGTVVTRRADGMPHRLLRTPYVERLERGTGLATVGPSIRRAIEFKRMSGLSWAQFVRDGMTLRRAGERSWWQLMQAANTPMLLKAGLVDGDPDAGVLAAGQVVGVIDDLPTVDELVDRVIAQAVDHLAAGGRALDPR